MARHAEHETLGSHGPARRRMIMDHMRLRDEVAYVIGALTSSRRQDKVRAYRDFLRTTAAQDACARFGFVKKHCRRPSREADTVSTLILQAMSMSAVAHVDHDIIDLFRSSQASLP